MKKKRNSFFAGDPEPERNDQDPRKRKLFSDPSPLRRTSMDPLYETTDRYRKVTKPMKVEDFLSSDA